MKKLSTILISLLLMALLLGGCGTTESGQEEPTEESQAEVQESETHYTEHQTEMSNYMSEGSALIDNGWIYTTGWGADTHKPLFLKMREDGTDDTVLKYFNWPDYINVKGEYIYAVLIGDEGRNVYRFRLGGEDEEKIVSNADYLQIIGDELYYCKCKDGSNDIINYCKCNLDGSNEQVVLDKEVYYPYLIENYLYYQDDDDNETIHRYNIETKEDIQLTKEKTYGFVLNDDSMYCIENDKSAIDGDYEGYLVKVDLETLESKTLYDNVSTGGFSIKDNTVYFINTNDECRVYSIDKNGENISLVTQDTYCRNLMIFDNKLLYYCTNNYEYIDDYYICNLDGSDKKSIKKEY